MDNMHIKLPENTLVRLRLYSLPGAFPIQASSVPFHLSFRYIKNNVVTSLAQTAGYARKRNLTGQLAGIALRGAQTNLHLQVLKEDTHWVVVARWVSIHSSVEVTARKPLLHLMVSRHP